MKVLRQEYMRRFLPFLFLLTMINGYGQCELNITGDSWYYNSCNNAPCVSLSFDGTPPFDIANTLFGPLASDHPDDTFTHCDFNNTGGEYIVVDSQGCSGSVIVNSTHYEWFWADVVPIIDDGVLGVQLNTNFSWYGYYNECENTAYYLWSNDTVIEIPLQQIDNTYQILGLPPGEYFYSELYSFCGFWSICMQGEGSAVLMDPNVNMTLDVLLAGPMGSNNIMDDDLRSSGLVPVSEPYSDHGYIYTGTGLDVAMEPSLLADTGIEAIVDWVIVELRTNADDSSIVESRPVLVRRDGSVIDVAGNSEISFGVPPGNYHIAIRHRNHLGVMTAAPVALSATPTSIDFTDPATPTWGTNARKNVNGTMVLWPGDVNFDGSVGYTGAGNDRDPILQAIGGTIATNTLTGIYSGSDVNLDGVVRYTGADNDRDIILQTIGGVVPTAVKVEQVP